MVGRRRWAAASFQGCLGLPVASRVSRHQVPTHDVRALHAGSKAADRGHASGRDVKAGVRAGVPVPWRLAGRGHPLLAQHVAAELVNRARRDRSGHVDPSDVGALVDRAVAVVVGAVARLGGAGVNHIRARTVSGPAGGPQRAATRRGVGADDTSGRFAGTASSQSVPHTSPLQHAAEMKPSPSRSRMPTVTASQSSSSLSHVSEAPG